MATIDQVIGIIPDAGHRGVDARTLFVTKQEAFQDAITDAFVPQLNTFRVEANLLASEVNSLRNATATDKNTATTQAGIATTKAVEANTSANQALASKNAIQAYVIPAGASYSIDQINTQNSVMTKAQFNALAEERKANRAGSGFDSFGKHFSSGTEIPINQGMNTTMATNRVFIGRRLLDGIGESKTQDPYICISGVVSKLLGINSAETTIKSGVIELPTAPNIYPYDTVLTAEQIASGVIKHADASNSGLIVNGKFDTDTSGWNVYSNASISWDNGKMLVNITGTSGGFQTILSNSPIIGKTYIVEFDVISGTYTGDMSMNIGGATASYTTTTGRKSLVITATTNSNVLISTRQVVATGTISIDNIAVYPADAISRSDLVFLESWHEDISEKNFVYPLGNVQYLGGNTDGLTGIANGAFTGFETYSLFGFVN